MADSALGSSKASQMSRYSPGQQQIRDQILQNPNIQKAINQYLQPTSQADYDKLFYESYEKPAQEQFKQQVIPGIINEFVGEDSRESSALNEALAQAGKDLSTTIAGQKANYMYGQQNLQSGIIGQILQMLSQGDIENVVQQKEGWFPVVMDAAAKGASGYGGRRY